jgi:glutamine amidotransferase
MAASHALVRQSVEDRKGNSHNDGWGIAYFDDDSAPVVRKNFKPASKDSEYAEQVGKLHAPVWLAHVRAASAGSVRLENTHPFQSGRWVWVHNGTLIKSLSLLSHIIVDNVAPELRGLRGGETDSELCFMLFLTELLRRSSSGIDDAKIETAVPAMRAVITFLNTIAAPLGQKPPTMNFMASNGSMLLASRWGKSLWTLQKIQSRHGNEGDTTRVYIASEPFDDDDWVEVPERSLVVVNGDGKLHIPALEA